MYYKSILSIKLEKEYENKPNNATDSKPAESTSEKETTESTTSTGNQEKPAQ